MKPVSAVFQYLRNRTVLERDDGSSAGHRLDHHQSEGLAPRDREEKPGGIAQEFLLLVLADLADEIDIASPEQRLDRGVEIFPIDPIHLGSDLERNAGARRDANRGVRRLLRGDAPEEGKISSASIALAQQILGQPVQHRRDEVRFRQRHAL